MKRIATIFSVALLAAAGWQIARACAPEFFRAVFTYARHPDLPRTEFVDGRLGVLQPTFARSYLVIAYRYLNGIGMNPAEREQARDYYKDRETNSWDHIGVDWPARWRSIRSQIKSPIAPPSSLITGGQLAYDPETHTFALNCAEDAFRIAIHTLEARRSRFGPSSNAFRSWLTAQDMVFQNCERAQLQIPPPASPALPPLIRADRDYQIAAAHFYAGDYSDALETFRRIGRDSTSPWQNISRYLVVRTLLRLVDYDPNASAQLQAEAQSILSDPTLASIHGITWNLVQRAGIRQKDPTYFQELARLLSASGQDDGLREELWNYTDLYDEIIGDAGPNNLFRPADTPPADPSRFRDTDLSDWIFNFQSRDASVFAHCLTRWQQTRSPSWLLAALSHSGAPQARTTGLLNAAERVPESSPAYLTARFHLLRVYEELGDHSAARDGLDAVLRSVALQSLPSSANLFRGLRMLDAPNFEEFVRFATRKPVLITLQENLGESPDFYPEENIKPPAAGDLLDADATRILNRRTPFRLLKTTALNTTLPPQLHFEALLTAFTRALMLGEDLGEIAKSLAESQPELEPFTTAYLNETTDDGRRFAAAFLLLHRPEARRYFAPGITRQSRPGKLDPYRDNWWCPTDIAVDLDSRANLLSYWRPRHVVQNSTAEVVPGFVDASVSAESKRELDRLDTLGAATDFLGSIVLPFARAHPDDSRVPEALYWLVRAGHYGCAASNTWKTTRDAFRELHRHYPNTSWAKRTPTWFKNDFDIHQEIRAQPRE